MYIYIYIYCVYMYIHIQRERGREMFVYTCVLFRDTNQNSSFAMHETAALRYATPDASREPPPVLQACRPPRLAAITAGRCAST